MVGSNNYIITVPHKYYHGRTGVVFNVSPRAVGVIVFKVVGNRYMEKRVNVRIEHVRHSKVRSLSWIFPSTSPIEK
jgi:ribosomal protein L21E